MYRPPVDLRTYLDRTRRTRADIARAAALRWQTVDLIARGQVRPRVETAKRISAATGGAVTVATLLGLGLADITGAEGGAGE